MSMLFDTLKQYLLTPVCIRCGSYFSQDSLFCDVCFHLEIEPKLFTSSASHLGNSRHKYLIAWCKNESRTLDQMVYRMKSDNSRAAWRFYSRLILEVIDINLKNFDGVVPIPGSSRASVHSALFADALSSALALPVFDLVTKNRDSVAQKHGSFHERKVQNFEARQPSQTELFTKLIFVDDVLTTGESFLQSNRAVNGHKENIILTLFYRPKAR